MLKHYITTNRVKYHSNSTHLVGANYLVGVFMNNKIKRQRKGDFIWSGNISIVAKFTF